MSDNIPIGMLQNYELFNALCALAISGGADIRTLFMVAQVAGIEAAFMHRLKQYGLAPTLGAALISRPPLEGKL